MNWRFIDNGSHNAFYNMALDETISESVRKGFSPPTLRLYQWTQPSVSLGYFQKVSDINIDYCQRKSYQLVRRLTGGKAVLHNSELTYSISARNDTKPFKGKGLLENYMIISTVLVTALKTLNVDAKITSSRIKQQTDSFCFKTSSYSEITVNGQKIIGSAQKLYRNGFLQQGSILMDINPEELNKIFKNYAIGETSYEVGTIKKYAPSLSIQDLKTALKEAFEKILGTELILKEPTELELDNARKLQVKKYATQEWNFYKQFNTTP